MREQLQDISDAYWVARCEIMTYCFHMIGKNACKTVDDATIYVNTCGTLGPFLD